MRPQATALWCLLVPVLLAGCSAEEATEGEESGSGGGLVFGLPDDVSLLVSGPVDGTSDARFPGELAVVDGCLGIEIGDVGYVVVWPEGTVPGEGDATGLVTPDGTEVPLGTTIEGGGGSVAADEMADAAPDLPESCADVDEVAVLGTVEVP